jgi:biotin transporter BioY
MPAGAPVVSTANPGYCVDNSVAGALPAAPSAANLVAAGATVRIAVTMQTFAVMMVGAIAGRWGGFGAAALYVAMVCVGAPFQAASGGKGVAVWDKGGVVSVSGGFFWGFIAAAVIMGRAMERGAGRGSSWRSALWLLPHMVGAEAAIYACGLFWYPFGAAIRANVAASATPVLGCSATRGGEVSANKCLYTIFNVMMVPYLPGECFKMLLVLATVPACWALLLRLHRWRHGGGDFVREVMDSGGDGEAAAGAVAEKIHEQEAAVMQVRAPAAPAQ